MTVLNHEPKLERGRNMICLKNIVKTYNKGKSNAYEALHGISMEIQDGEMTAVNLRSRKVYAASYSCLH